jgi:hypothetical protein
VHPLPSFSYRIKFKDDYWLINTTAPACTYVVGNSKCVPATVVHKRNRRLALVVVARYNSIIVQVRFLNSQRHYRKLSDNFFSILSSTAVSTGIIIVPNSDDNRFGWVLFKKGTWCSSYLHVAAGGAMYLLACIAGPRLSG